MISLRGREDSFFFADTIVGKVAASLSQERKKLPIRARIRSDVVIHKSQIESETI